MLIRKSVSQLGSESDEGRLIFDFLGFRLSLVLLDSIS